MRINETLTRVRQTSVALYIQHANRMRRVILSSVSSPALPHFPTLSQKGHDFRKKKFLFNTKCVF